MTTYEKNYKARLDEMLDAIIRNRGHEDRVAIWFATLVEKYYNHPNYDNRELMENYFKKYMKNA